MELKDLQSQVHIIFTMALEDTGRRRRSEAEDVGLSNDSVKFAEAAILCADPRKSSKIFWFLLCVPRLTATA
jgi:hypothetical protein